MPTKIIMFAATVLLGIGVILGVAYYASQTKEAHPVATSTNNSHYKIELVPTGSQAEVSVILDREIHFGASIPSDVRITIEDGANAVRGRLKEDPTRGDDWFTLGVLYHSANDFEGAKAVWEFLEKVIAPPELAVVYDNLGKLYKFDIKDFPKSESYFKKSMIANPKSITPYIELFELYRYVYKTNTSAGVDIMLVAAAKFPESADPYALLGAYYRESGDVANARTYYTKALDRARALGNVALIDALGEELSKLPK